MWVSVVWTKLPFSLIAGTDMVTSHLEQYRHGSLAALGDLNSTNLVDDT